LKSPAPRLSPTAVFRSILLPQTLIVLALLWLLGDQLTGDRGWRLHAPDLALLAQETFAVQLHLLTALSALLVALFLLSGAKGTRVHRIVGWVWSGLMMTVALSSFFIMQINPGRMSWIHILSGYVAVSAPLGLWAARTHRVTAHQRIMVGLVVGGLIIAGAFTFAPGRLMWRMFFG
jgi:uncharacterized membrane protein